MKNKGPDDIPDWMEVPKDRIPDFVMKDKKNCEVWEVRFPFHFHFILFL